MENLFHIHSSQSQLLKIHLKSKSWTSEKRGRKISKARNSVIWNKGSLKQTTSVVFNPMGFSTFFFFFSKSHPLMKSNVRFRKEKKYIYTKLETSGNLKSLSMCLPVSAPDLSLLMERGPSIVSSQQFISATIYLISLQWDKYLLEKKNFSLIFNSQSQMQNWTQKLGGIAMVYTIA